MKGDNRVKIGVSKKLLAEIEKMFPARSATFSLENALIFLVNQSKEATQMAVHGNDNEPEADKERV